MVPSVGSAGNNRQSAKTASCEISEFRHMHLPRFQRTIRFSFPARLQICPAGMVLSKLGVSGMIGTPPEKERLAYWFLLEMRSSSLLGPSRPYRWRGFAFQQGNLGLEFSYAPEQMAGAFPAHLAVEVFPAVLSLLGVPVHGLRARHAASGTGHCEPASVRLGKVDVRAGTGRTRAQRGILMCAMSRHKARSNPQKAMRPMGTPRNQRSHDGT